MPNTDEQSWDEGHPLITDPRRDGAGEILNLRKAINDRISKEHEALAAAGVGGEHKEGSAMVYYQATAPTLQPDGVTSLGASDDGRLWIDSDTLQLAVWDGNSWEPIQSLFDATQIFQFEKLNTADDVPSLPFFQGSLTPGTYIVFLEGTTIDGSGSSSVTLSATINAITREMDLDNIPDGTAPFLLVFHITVAGAGTCNLTAISNAQSVTSMSGFLTVAT